MSILTHFSLPSCDGDQLACYSLVPKTTPRAVVQISHGMAEHARRYELFADHLQSYSIAVVAHDHRGHGATTAGKTHGHFADSNGIEKAIADINIVASHIKASFPGVPHILLGHSMGSLLARLFASEHGEILSGLIISGTATHPGFKGVFGKAIAHTESFFRGKQAKSKLMDKLLFGTFNTQFAPNRTPFDWLSRDNDQVDLYCADPFCGFLCTTTFYKDLITLAMKANTRSCLKKIPSNVPVFIISGTADPVGNNGKGVKRFEALLAACEVKNVTLKLYADARHELLNEINNEVVYSDITTWITQNILKV